MTKVLIVDDEKVIRLTLREILEFENYLIEEAVDGEDAIQKITNSDYDLVLCDIKMPKKDGIEVLSKARELGNETQFVMISAHANIDVAIEATKLGAFDFIQKPPDLNRLLITVRNALKSKVLEQETKVLKKKIAKKFEIVGESLAITSLLRTIDKVAPSDARVFITGPNGSGKELVAKLIHEKSNRANAPMIEVNCAAIPSELIESELFGHEKGSFTSAIKQRIGNFELANGGTLFLDEIGDMSLAAQAKVLRALQENKITRVGGEKEIKIDVRIIAATNKDIKKEIQNNNFREDLYHRLAVIPLYVPPLHERKDDIKLLVSKFLKDLATEYGNMPKIIEPKGLEYLEKYNWPGNIRELRNVVERLVIMSEKNITFDDVKMYTGF